MAEMRHVWWRIIAGRRESEVVRYENGERVLVAICESTVIAELACNEDRNTVLADPLAHEFRAVEWRVRN